LTFFFWSSADEFELVLVVHSYPLPCLAPDPHLSHHFTFTLTFISPLSLLFLSWYL
jgi:hypothetical protein